MITPAQAARSASLSYKKSKEDELESLREKAFSNFYPWFESKIQQAVKKGKFSIFLDLKTDFPGNPSPYELPKSIRSELRQNGYHLPYCPVRHGIFISWE